MPGGVGAASAVLNRIAANPESEWFTMSLALSKTEGPNG
jgi:hypothetical protein